MTLKYKFYNLVLESSKYEDVKNIIEEQKRIKFMLSREYYFEKMTHTHLIILLLIILKHLKHYLKPIIIFLKFYNITNHKNHFLTWILN